MLSLRSRGQSSTTSPSPLPTQRLNTVMRSSIVSTRTGSSTIRAASTLSRSTMRGKMFAPLPSSASAQPPSRAAGSLRRPPLRWTNCNLPPSNSSTANRNWFASASRLSRLRISLSGSGTLRRNWNLYQTAALYFRSWLPVSGK